MEAFILTFPWQPIGSGLRALSLRGGFQNVLAILLYGALSLLPLLALLILVRTRRACRADGLLVLLSGFLFVLLYCGINPGLLGGPLLFPVLCGTFDAFLLLYLVLRFVRFSAGLDLAALTVLAARFCLLCAGFVLLAALIRAGWILTGGQAGEAGAFLTEGEVMASGRFLALADLFLPALAEILVLVRAFFLLKAMREGPYTAGAAMEAGRLERTARGALLTVLVWQAAAGIWYFFLFNRGWSGHMEVSLDLGLIGLCLFLMLSARIISEGVRLREENDLFV